MTVYLIKNNQILKTYKNVTSWSEKCVMYTAGVATCKTYAKPDTYFSDKKPENSK